MTIDYALYHGKRKCIKQTELFFCTLELLVHFSLIIQHLISLLLPHVTCWHHFMFFWHVLIDMPKSFPQIPDMDLVGLFKELKNISSFQFMEAIKSRYLLETSNDDGNDDVKIGSNNNNRVTMLSLIWWLSGTFGFD